MKIRYVFWGLMVLLFSGCYHEDDITVNNEDEFHPSLASGHDYDQTLAEWHEKYGFYPLYIFTDRDIYWNNTDWDNPNFDVWKGNHIGKQGDPLYVGQLVDLIKQTFMEVYSDECLKYFPLRMLLCSELYETKYSVRYDPVLGDWIPGYDSTAIWAFRGYDFIAINGGSEKIETLNAKDKKDFQIVLNQIFLEYLNVKGLFVAPDEFFEISDYEYGYLRGDDLFARGFLAGDVLQDGDENESKTRDFAYYVKLAACNLDMLEGEVDKSKDGEILPLWIGALNSTERDVNGLCARKYRIVVEYLKNFGLNILKLQEPELE